MNHLEEILIHKRREVEKQKRELDLEKLIERITPRTDPRPFQKTLQKKERVALIAEIKKASPSAGVIRSDFQPTSLARHYERGGADALSILTDRRFFQGHLKYLLQARAATVLPCLRKDFIVDEYQIWEARLAEADAILLIVAALTKQELTQFLGIAAEAEVEALVEVHDQAELETALEVGATLIGINNRNLHTFKTDLKVTEHLVPKIPPGKIIVSESGISKFEDVQKIHQAGVHAILVGESLMREADVASAVRKLLGLGHENGVS